MGAWARHWGGWLVLCCLPSAIAYGVPKGPAGQLYRRFVVSLSDAKPCVLLLDAAGEMGCASRGEVAGPLSLIDSEADVKAFQQPGAPGVVVLGDGLFELHIDALAASLRVQGVIVHRASNNTKVGFSPAERVPNRRFYPAQAPWVSAEWNAAGTGRLMTRYPFPIWLLTDTANFAELKAKAEENRLKDSRGDSGARWVAQTTLTMAAANRTAARCLTNRKCQPLGGGTTWATLQPIKGPAISRPIIACMAGTSSSSLFHDVVPAADAVVAHVVAMLVAFDALAKMPGLEALDKEILFLFFPGEDYGYLGSSRFVHDITTPYSCSTDGDAKNQLACRKPYLPSKDYLKIRPDKFTFLLDVSQVGHVDIGDLFVHAASDNQNTTKLVEALKAQGVRAQPPSKRGLPPTSLVPFLQDPQISQDAGAAVLTGFSRQFNNRYYSSIYDDASQVDETKVVRAASVVANALWGLAAGEGTVPVDAQLAHDLLHCLTVDFRCGMVRGLFPGGTPPKTATWYVGAFQHRYEPGTPEQRFIFRFLAERTVVASKGNCTAPKDCKYRETGMMCVKNECMRSAAYMHQGYSPAVSWDYTDNRWVMNATLANAYSSVVESDWPSQIGIQVVLEDTQQLEALIFGGGVATTALAAIGWMVGGRYFTNKFKLD